MLGKLYDKLEKSLLETHFVFHDFIGLNLLQITNLIRWSPDGRNTSQVNLIQFVIELNVIHWIERYHLLTGKKVHIKSDLTEYKYEIWYNNFNKFIENLTRNWTRNSGVGLWDNFVEHLFFGGVEVIVYI